MLCQQRLSARTIHRVQLEKDAASEAWEMFNLSNLLAENAFATQG